MAGTDTTTEALTQIIRILEPLSSEDRQRATHAAMVFLGETPKVTGAENSAMADGVDRPNSEAAYPTAVSDWIHRHGISTAELDQVFHFKGDGDFDIHDVPGTSKREKTLNTYVLTGVGIFLMTKGRGFNDSLARGFCQTIGCYDATNHAKYLAEKHSEFSGNKNAGFQLTNVGIKRGAELVKLVVSAA